MRAFKYIVGLLIVSLLGTVFFGKLVFTNLILARGDMFLYFYPYWDYRAQALLSGHLPLWNPYLFMGVPFLANSQSGVLYPLNWPLAFFPAPTAVKIALVFHIILAAAGAALFAHRVLRLSGTAALLAAILFAHGGYLTAQVEHINQLQGLAWFPWLLLAGRGGLIVWRAAFRNRGTAARQFPAGPWIRPLVFGLSSPAPCALCLALQLLAGHTQSVVISFAGLAIYLLIGCRRSSPFIPPATARPVSRREKIRPIVRQLLLTVSFLLSAMFIAALLAAAQLLPTFELAAESLRRGGLPLNEALSFSLDPRLLGRALLPSFSRSMFSEFVAYPGMVGLALAALGASRQRECAAAPSELPAVSSARPLSPPAPRRAMSILALVGLTAALGAFNPLYVAAAALPPLALFRVPARWLFLFAFGTALLAASGFDHLEASCRRLAARRCRGNELRLYGPLLLALIPICLVPFSMNLTPPGETGPLGTPAPADWAGWFLPLAVLCGLIAVRLPPRLRQGAIIALATAELFCAAQTLPHNHLTAPESYTSIRPAMTQLIARLRLPPTTPPQPPIDAPYRFLSLSALRFDPGDAAELHSAWDDRLPPSAVYDAIVAVKHKEVLSPNLSLRWHIPAVDGYDGGLLPLRHYAEFSRLFTGTVSPDGRLRENLTHVPAPHLLSLANIRYLITDKVGDAWIDDVFYDLQFTLRLAAGEEAAIAYVPKFQATALGVAADHYSGYVRVTFADGATSVLPITSGRVHFPQAATPIAITLGGPLNARGLTLIDERAGVFHSLTLGPYRLVHSGDVKIYENLLVRPRAFVAARAVVVANSAEAGTTLAAPDFDPAATVILAAPPSNAEMQTPPQRSSSPAGRPSARITMYTPEIVRVAATGPGWLVLTDAWYPGWTATLDGAAVPILRADVMFRAVALPPGEHTVEFRYEPPLVTAGLCVSGGTIVGLVIMLLIRLWPRRNRKAAGG